MTSFNGTFFSVLGVGEPFEGTQLQPYSIGREKIQGFVGQVIEKDAESCDRLYGNGIWPICDIRRADYDRNTHH